MTNTNESLKDYGYDLAGALAKLAKIDRSNAKTIIDSLRAGDMIAFANAVDNDDLKTAREILKSTEFNLALHPGEIEKSTAKIVSDIKEEPAQIIKNIKKILRGDLPHKTQMRFIFTEIKNLTPKSWNKIWPKLPQGLLKHLYYHIEKTRPEIIDDNVAHLIFKNAGSQIQEANKMNKTKNPVAANLRDPKFAHKVEKSKDEVEKKKDKWDRKSKHHISKGEMLNKPVLVDFEIGDEVVVEGKQGIVKIPSGPNNTVGIIVENKLKMFDQSQISRLDEMVLGMLALNPINRIKQLAGIDEQSGENEQTAPLEQTQLTEETDQNLTEVLASLDKIQSLVTKLSASDKKMVVDQIMEMVPLFK